MFCTNCGKNLPDGAVFCNECGSRCGRPVSTETVIMPTVPEAAPEAPVNQETVIVPLVSSERTVLSEPVADMQTMMVPEVSHIPMEPAQDPLEQMFPQQQPKKNNMGLIIGLVAAAVVLVTAIVTVILGMLNNWWRETPQVPDSTSTSTTTTASTPEPTEPEPPTTSEDEELTPEQQRDKLSAFDAAGLTLYLGDEFKEVERDEDFICYEAGSLEVNVIFGYLSEVGEDIDSSRKLAKYYEELEKDNYDSIQRNKQHGIYYIVATEDDETTVCGFYAAKGYGWVVSITTDDFDTLGQTLIDYVTLGQVSQDFVPPAPEVEVQTQKFSFAGLELTLDGTMRATDFDDYCVYENEKFTVRVQLTPLADVQGSTSKEYAQWYMNQHREQWQQISLETADEEFYYVAMVNEEDWVNLVGLYTYGDMAWILSVDTTEGEKYAQTLADYITSGRIIPEDVPQTQTEVQLALGELKLTLSGAYQESYRDTNNVLLSNGVLDVTVSSGSYVGQSDAPQTPEEMAQKDYDEAKGLWDNAEIDTLNGVCYVALWENTADAVNVVQGYYLVDGTWWTICVETAGDEHLTDMKLIATCGVAPESKQPTFQKGELVSRQRITLEGQSTADYQGLQISFSPDWTLDPTWGNSGAYYWEDLTMVADKRALADVGVSNALELIWKAAEEQYTLWQNYEVGLAGGVPYLILWNENTQLYTVVGAYADSTDCWQIMLQFVGADFVDQAIWYATAGVLPGGSAMA